MIVPSATNMKFKFPEFIPVDDASIEFAVEEAVVACGTAADDHGEWVDDANQTLAIMYYAAHLLKMSMLQAEATSGGGILSSERTPELSLTYKVPELPTSGQITDFYMTRYGRKFRELIDLNFPAVMTVNSAIRP